MRQELTKTISDDHGAQHSYDIIQHPASAGIRLFTTVLESLAMPAGQMLSALQSGGSLPDSGDGLMGMLLDDGVDGEGIGKAFELLAGKLLQCGPELFHDILKHVSRDNVSMNNLTAFDGAYQGNYGELVRAVAWSLQVNFGDAFKAAKSNFGLVSSAK